VGGGDPAALPIERPTKFETVRNMRTTRALGTSIPTSYLLRADEVIERGKREFITLVAPPLEITQYPPQSILGEVIT